MIAELGGLQLQQLPKLAQYVLPDDPKEDSMLEHNLAAMRDGQMELGIVLSRDWGNPETEDAQRIIYAMKTMAMVYEELNRIKYEILSMYLSNRKQGQY